MQLDDTTPRFRNLSINNSPHFVTTPFFTDKYPEEQRDPEKECFMCRQANVYLSPIGMQQERRVARHHPPPLTRAQIEELSQKKHLNKREVRKLLQCYFPEIKNIKYFQLHKYHSCCYDPQHVNLCKNHITALQHDKTHNGQQNRVSFVRIKIEPTKGIPTRFLGPAALPESLADMLIQQVNRFENKKKPPAFVPTSQSALEMYDRRRFQPPYGHDVSRLSEHLANLDSDDDDDDDDDDSESDEETTTVGKHYNTPNSNIRGYHGKVPNLTRLKIIKKIPTPLYEKDEHIRKRDASTNITNGDLTVEDLDELDNYFVNEKLPSTSHKSTKLSKKRRRRKRKLVKVHQKPKLNHWEELALNQSRQETCGCRHHVRRLEANQIVYDWCRCKDHLHRDVKEGRKSIAPITTYPVEVKEKTPTPKPKVKKAEKRTVGVNATQQTTTELALQYDPSTIDYDVIEEVLYYRTSSGRLVKPEISSSFSYTDRTKVKGLTSHRSSPRKSGLLSTTPKSQYEVVLDSSRSQQRNEPPLTNRGSVSNGQPLGVDEISSTVNRTNTLMPIYESPKKKEGGVYRDDDDEEDEEEGTGSEEEEQEEEKEEEVQFIPPKYVPEIAVKSPIPPIQPAVIPMSLQKSTKPTFINHKPTPNFERETSVLANRRWYDQALGDQNLLPVHDGQYGLIAGTSAEQYHLHNEILGEDDDNDYVEPEPPKNRGNCTIS